MVTDTDPGNPVNADMWRAIGRLEGAEVARIEGATAALLEGQREIKAGLQALTQHLDRLFYTILAVGGAVIAAVVATRFIGG